MKGATADTASKPGSSERAISATIFPGLRQLHDSRCLSAGWARCAMISRSVATRRHRSGRSIFTTTGAPFLRSAGGPARSRRRPWAWARNGGTAWRAAGPVPPRRSAAPPRPGQFLDGQAHALGPVGRLARAEVEQAAQGALDELVHLERVEQVAEAVLGEDRDHLAVAVEVAVAASERLQASHGPPPQADAFFLDGAATRKLSPSLPASAATASPSLTSPVRSMRASGSTTSREIARLSGRAPKAGS